MPLLPQALSAGVMFVFIFPAGGSPLLGTTRRRRYLLFFLKKNLKEKRLYFALWRLKKSR